jgi:plasmid stabilization system protein ParE
MNVRKADDFIADVERQFDWYLAKAGWEVADRYLDAVETTCRLLGQHPKLGPSADFTHPLLREWRFFVSREEEETQQNRELQFPRQNRIPIERRKRPEKRPACGLLR